MKQKKAPDISNNRFTIITTIVIVVIFIASLVYYYNHTIINDGQLNDINSDQYMFQIENVVLDMDSLTISGWCFDIDELSNEKSASSVMRIILINTDNYKDTHYFKADNSIERQDVDEYYIGGSNLNYCGFNGDIDTQKLDITNKDYEIVLQPNVMESTTLRPDIFIHSGEVVYSNPDSYKPLEVDGTDLEEIVNDGVLRIYRPELGIYVYQYDWKLYYITDSNYPFDKGWTSLGLNIFTNHPELLPVDRQEHGFENLGFVFSEHEITDSIDSGQYRVAVFELPSSYPITYINTGHSESLEGWIWINRFCPGLPKNGSVE